MFQQVARFALTGDSSLYILLPRSNTVADLQQVEEKMTDTAVREMIEQMKTTPPQSIEVTLPQIKLDVQPDMNILIKKLGLFIFHVLFCPSVRLNFLMPQNDATHAFSLCITLSTSQYTANKSHL